MRHHHPSQTKRKYIPLVSICIGSVVLFNIILNITWYHLEIKQPHHEKHTQDSLRKEENTPNYIKQHHKSIGTVPKAKIVEQPYLPYIFEHIQASCPTTQTRIRESFDPKNTWVKPVNVPPLRSPFLTIDMERIIGGYIPERSESGSSKNGRKAGGLTADMGWVLMVARFSVTNVQSGSSSYYLPKFPSYWGHGCDAFGMQNIDQSKESSLGRWECFFKPITPELLLEAKPGIVFKGLIQENAPDRHAVKLKELYKSENPNTIRRNRLMTRISNVQNEENDLQTMRTIFRWIFQLQPHVRVEVNDRKHKVYQKMLDASPPGTTMETLSFISFHIRRGDKIGLKSGPKEGTFVSAKQYLHKVKCHYEYKNRAPPPVIFVATDDYQAVTEVQKIVGDYFTVVSTASPEASQGFSINDYKREATIDGNFEKTLQLWTEMEILSEGDVFVGHFESNIGQTVHLMRMGKHPDTSISAQLLQYCSTSIDRRINIGSAWLCASSTSP